MSDTPRTDAEPPVYDGFPSTVSRDFARQLERELVEVKFSAEHRKHLLEGAIFHREKAEQERDNLREALVYIHGSIGTREHEQQIAAKALSFTPSVTSATSSPPK